MGLPRKNLNFIELCQGLLGQKVVQESKSLLSKFFGNRPGFLDNHGGCPLKKTIW
jgi:hypothetical protein